MAENLQMPDSALPTATRSKRMTLCRIEGCTNHRREAETICSMHSARKWRTGSWELKSESERVLERLFKNISFNVASGCWIWKGTKNKQGYGVFRTNRKTKFVHRYLYEIFIGKLGDYLGCHSCDTPECVSPIHVFPGTQKDNIQDSVSKGRFAAWRTKQ
jgi:hypothetical protein